MWDELDELRRWQDEAIDPESYKTLEDERDDALDERDKLREAILTALDVSETGAAVDILREALK